MISPENIHRILIAVDDSSYSEQAVNYGVLLAKKTPHHADQVFR